MNRKYEAGMAGLAVLSLLFIASVLSYGVLALAQQRRTQAQNDGDDARAVQMAFEALVLARKNNFEPFEDKDVQLIRHWEEPSRLQVVCAAASGFRRKIFETGWRKSGDQWQATYWRELK